VCSWNVVITPVFWDWLTSFGGVSFDHSLVFISACETGATPVLRDFIKARAYFDFTGDVEASFATGVEQYLVESLARPTHSPEEAFYNMLRIEKTHQMIYKEDALFKALLGAPGSAASFDILGAWGWNGHNFVDYRDSGWLSGSVDAGEVWWMLYALRWVKNTTDAATQMTQCLNKYWLQGNPGGLASIYCNSANAGLPKDKSRLTNDVDYAIYLLTGQAPSGLPPDAIPPRWTMND